MRKEKTLSKTFVIFSMYELSEQPAREKAEDKTDLNNQTSEREWCSYAAADTLTIYHNAK